MKRSELVVGAVVAHSTYQDWQDNALYPVTVVDTRAFSTKRYRGSAATIDLEDGTTARGDFYAVDPSKSTALVRTASGDLRLVPLGQLKGDYTACKSLVDARYRARRQREAELAAHRETARQRVHAAATQLKELGVPIGFISRYDTELKLNATQLEKILELVVAKG
jgi:beta-phosphoglucomutase-like phosphatase (HAD superfamily)